jgi:hypothetical protein
MTLLELRQKLVQLSGRYDLVVDTTDYVDNGANFFINAGQRWLDRKVDHRQFLSRHFKVVSAGEIGVTFPLSRGIQQVWVQDSVNQVRQLVEKKTANWLMEEYYSPFSEITGGIPLYYYPAYLRTYPSNPLLNDLQMYLHYADVAPMVSDDKVYDGIIFMPPADTTYVIEVWGYFYTEEFTVDTQSTYWSVTVPEVLLFAALRMMEVFKRNSEGVKDWEYAIKEQLQDIDRDAADEDASDAVEMEG